MVTLDSAFEVDEPGVIFEESDGDIVLVDLRSGKYYRLADPSSAVFSLIVSGKSLNHVASQCNSPDVARNELGSIARDLVERQLIRPRGAVDTTAIDPWNFSDFILDVFEDLQEILKLDPIHESDPESGWPHRRT